MAAAYTKIKKDEDMVIDKNHDGPWESYIFDPYNPLNKQIQEDEIKELLAKYNVIKLFIILH